ncbi:carboxymuconolactone decarboxylase family protein [Sediminicola luteus]|uniref:Carboxymuconolactone decarboxylase-like domain-containing protein n=1 Tax=Sediminicola luteus TaxID=319238 RepID=A0A2A4G470_9FLAO|nr:carboxymuconolactone decarboxylase family protein [Sediminicola luteus]PCE62770.1 hypothetical protein B7P33_15905 [Sediminicola luteus]
MENRIQIDQLAPEVYGPLMALEKYLNECGLDRNLKHLIKIRASQLNQCAFCLDMHIQEALKDGAEPQRLYLLNAWRHSDLFTEKEEAVLAVAEEVTLIHKQGLSAKTYHRALAFFDEATLAQIILIVVAINGWNRIAVSTLKPLP